MKSMFRIAEKALCLMWFVCVQTYAGDAVEAVETTLPPHPEIQANEARVIVYREGKGTEQALTIFVNDRVEGSLLPGMGARTLVCPGAFLLRVDTRKRTDWSGELGKNYKFFATKGQTVYFRVKSASPNKGDYVIEEVKQDQVASLTFNDENRSRVINRHQPNCQAPIPPKSKTIAWSLSADVLFDFDSSELKSKGKIQLAKLMDDIHAQNIQVTDMKLVGYTDRLGSEEYNDTLSLARANTAAQHLKQQYGAMFPILTEGHGARDPVVKDCCGQIASKELVACLQPNRRLFIEVHGTVQQ